MYVGPIHSTSNEWVAFNWQVIVNFEFFPAPEQLMDMNKYEE